MSQVITVVAVPEPSTIAMALAGLGGGSFCMLRRRRWLGGRAKR
jgi:hypothetical protein